MTKNLLVLWCGLTNQSGQWKIQRWTELLIIKGSSGITDIVSEYYRYMDNMYKDSIQIFTDGSNIYKQRQRDLLYISLDIMWE